MELLVISEVHDAELLDRVAEVISEIFGIKVRYSFVDTVVESVDYDISRGQYDAARVVERVRRGFVVKDLVLLVTDKDLYVDGLNFVFGYAPYPVGIISTHRLNPGFYGQPFDPSVFLKRVLTEAVHEVGHLVGLKHCRNPSCVMYFSNSILDTDRKGIYPCGRCVSMAREGVRRLSSSCL
ncbi:MAG TPA: hypothetical protein EYH45_03675 [Candidatus Caldiarchaeum subterraneum]|uniref:Archaemetzincin n=1 Tax=Caldiarchaeum subterraneum TaxID=311458 RepID=A0A833ECB7_CALS0|nr:hypothetical protein [Aigarchaeota archaeon]HIQ29645.1 hypothetical protein [Candidatus Caldarchaeum subterraneum]